MKIICIGMVKNEADIIESYIRYHANIFDRIVLLDNKSTDRTPSIIQSLIAEGLPVDLIHDKSLEYSQAKKMTSLLYSSIKKYNPDIVFPLDVDEFLIAPHYSGNPRNLIMGLKQKKVYTLQRVNYLPDEHKQESLFIPHKCTILSDEKDNWPTVVITKKIAKKYKPDLGEGNHQLNVNGKRMKKTKRLSQLQIAHFQYRSLEQLKSKVLVGWINGLSKPNYRPGFYRHWEAIYTQLVERYHQVTIKELLGIKIGLEQRPINLSFCKSIEMKYTRPNEVDAMKNFLTFCQKLARDHAREKKKKQNGGVG